MRKILFLLFLGIQFLSAEEEKNPYLTSECDTLALIEGVVNAYNGRLVQIDQDIKIQGNDPLEMIRFYDGGHHFDSEFGYGVGSNHSSLLYLSYGIKLYAHVELRQGLEVICRIHSEKKNGNKIFAGGLAKEYYKTGFTNSCEGLLKGESSLHALRVEFHPFHAIVILGDGTKRFYSIFMETQRGITYRLTFEERPNGNRRHYSYYGNSFPFCLKRIHTTNRDDSLTLNWIDFSYKDDRVFGNFSKSHGATHQDFLRS